MKTVNDYKYSQRAVAPIIATLLMVAISVVGGILIFVFAQGFFTDTNIQTPNIESLEIFGYDARDTTTHRAHNDDPSVTTDDITIGNAVGGNLADGDTITVYVRNKGAGPITIERIKVFGTDYLWDVATTAAAISAATPAADNEFALSVDGINIVTSPVLGPGQEGTILLQYDELDNGKIKIGRPVPVVIITGNGAAFTKQVQNGVQVG